MKNPKLIKKHPRRLTAGTWKSCFSFRWFFLFLSGCILSIQSFIFRVETHVYLRSTKTLLDQRCQGNIFGLHVSIEKVALKNEHQFTSRTHDVKLPLGLISIWEDFHLLIVTAFFCYWNSPGWMNYHQPLPLEDLIMRQNVFLFSTSKILNLHIPRTPTPQPSQKFRGFWADWPHDLFKILFGVSSQGTRKFWKLTNSLYFLVETFHFFSIDPMRARAHPVSLLLPEEPKAVWTGKTPAEKALKMDTTGT